MHESFPGKYFTKFCLVLGLDLQVTAGEPPNQIGERNPLYKVEGIDARGPRTPTGFLVLEGSQALHHRTCSRNSLFSLAECLLRGFQMLLFGFFQAGGSSLCGLGHVYIDESWVV
jgi:hypothetical protein